MNLGTIKRMLAMLDAHMTYGSGSGGGGGGDHKNEGACLITGRTCSKDTKIRYLFLTLTCVLRSRPF
jgi:hypothetical protein